MARTDATNTKKQLEALRCSFHCRLSEAVTGIAFTAATPVILTDEKFVMINDGKSKCFTFANGRITATKKCVGLWSGACDFTTTSSDSNVTYIFELLKNGETVLVTNKIEIDAHNAPKSIPGNYILQMNEGDYVEVQLTADKNCTATIETLHLSFNGHEVY